MLYLQNLSWIICTPKDTSLYFSLEIPAKDMTPKRKKISILKLDGIILWVIEFLFPKFFRIFYTIMEKLMNITTWNEYTVQIGTSCKRRYYGYNNMRNKTFIINMDHMCLMYLFTYFSYVTFCAINFIRIAEMQKYMV